MSGKIDKTNLVITDENPYSSMSADNLYECRQALYDLIGMQQDDTIDAKATYYGMMLLRMTEPTPDQWKKALDFKS